MAIDFDDSISNLEKRAGEASRSMRLIGAMLLVTILILVVLILDQYQKKDGARFAGAFGLGPSSANLERALESRGSALVQSLGAPNLGPAAAQTAKNELKETVEILNTLRKHTDLEPNVTTNFGTSWATIAFSIGAVGFLVLLIQISVNSCATTPGWPNFTQHRQTLCARQTATLRSPLYSFNTSLLSA